MKTAKWKSASEESDVAASKKLAFLDTDLSYFHGLSFSPYRVRERDPGKEVEVYVDHMSVL